MRNSICAPGSLRMSVNRVTSLLTDRDALWTCNQTDLAFGFAAEGARHVDVIHSRKPTADDSVSVNTGRVSHSGT